MKALGMYPPEHHARAVALSETIGGGLTALGFLSPLGPAMIMGTMAVAIKKVHLKNGLWNSQKGYEFNLTLIAASFALAADGPGLLSVDWMLGKQRKGLGLGAGRGRGRRCRGRRRPAGGRSEGPVATREPPTVSGRRAALVTSARARERPPGSRPAPSRATRRMTIRAN